MGFFSVVRSYYQSFMEKYPTNQPEDDSVPKSVDILILGQIIALILTHIFLISDKYWITLKIEHIFYFFLVFSFSCYYRSKAIKAGRGVVVHNTAEFIVISSIVLFDDITVTLITISLHILSHFLFGLRNTHQFSFNYANELLSGSVVFIVYRRFVQNLLSISDTNIIVGAYILTISYYVLNNIQTIVVVWLVSGQKLDSILINSYDKREEFYIIVVSASAIVFTIITPNLYPLFYILIFMLFIQQISKELEINRKNQAELELKQLQHENEIQEQKELDLEKLKVLSGKVAHDIRNYLLVLSADLQLMGDQIEERRRERMSNAVTNIDEILDYLYDFSAGNNLILESIEINTFVKKIVELNLLGSGYQYEYNGLNDAKFVKIDSTKMKQVISNIIINAKEAIELENGKIEINLEVHEKENSYVIIKIKDNGSGIAKEDQNKIYEPFFSTKQRGSGLGLTTANHILLAHNGTLKFQSQPGVGTEFTISLPLTVEIQN